MPSRRNFLKASSIALAGTFCFNRMAWPFAQTPSGIHKFIVPLQGLGPTGIPVATPNTALFPGEDYYQIRVGEFTQQMHPDLPGPTKFWGFADVTNGQAPNHRYLGGVIVAQKGRPVRMKVLNRLPPVHPLPVDTTIMGGELEPNRCCVHLHGGLVPWTSDGGPYAWFSPSGTTGPSFLNGTGVAGEALYRYPNNQSARMVWYHDHSIGITRLNAYAGIASAYIISDPVEALLINSQIIPSNEVPLVIQDKTFVSQAQIDKGYTWGKVGDLWYPYAYEANSAGATGRWDYGPDLGQVISDPGKQSLPMPSAIPEFFSDTSVVNGTLYPYLSVERRHYRFRILNGSQARFYNLQLYYAQSGDSGEADTRKPGPRMIQIGTEGGFLPLPVALNNPPKRFSVQLDSSGDPIPSTMKFNLLLAPAERADVIIDFSDVPAGSKLILYNDAPAPFPMGDIRNDYFTGNADQTAAGGAPSTRSGFGPNLQTLMQFRVMNRTGAADPPTMNWLEALALGAGNAILTQLLPKIDQMEQKKAVRVRNLTLNEDFDEYGRLIQMLGTDLPNGSDILGNPFYGRAYMDPTTETVQNGSTEVWRIFNLTGDTHPMHFHLVNVQVISRQPFDAANYSGTPVFTGPARLPDANEFGWKETVRMHPGECTTIIMKFDLPKVPYAVPNSPRTGGAEYVWHCHILEHEEHDMMRPLVVV
jgi:spore coat protein A, manganese oxidase